MKFKEKQNRNTKKFNKTKKQNWIPKKIEQKFTLKKNLKRFKRRVFFQWIDFLQGKFTPPHYVTSGKLYDKSLNIHYLLQNELLHCEKLYQNIFYKLINIFSRCTWKQKTHFLIKNKFVYLFVINAVLKSYLLKKTIYTRSKTLSARSFNYSDYKIWVSNYKYHLTSSKYCNFLYSISYILNQKNNKLGREINVNQYYHLGLKKLHQKIYILKTLKNLKALKNQKILSHHKKKWSQKRYAYQIYKKSTISTRSHSRWKRKRKSNLSKNKKKLNLSKKILTNRPCKKNKKIISKTRNPKKGKHS